MGDNIIFIEETDKNRYTMIHKDGCRINALKMGYNDDGKLNRIIVISKSLSNKEPAAVRAYRLSNQLFENNPKKAEEIIEKVSDIREIVNRDFPLELPLLKPNEDSKKFYNDFQEMVPLTREAYIEGFCQMEFGKYGFKND